MLFIENSKIQNRWSFHNSDQFCAYVWNRYHLEEMHYDHNTKRWLLRNNTFLPWSVCCSLPDRAQWWCWVWQPVCGMVLYIGSAVAKRPMEKVVKATLPFYLYAGQGIPAAWRSGRFRRQWSVGIYFGENIIDRMRIFVHESGIYFVFWNQSIVCFIPEKDSALKNIGCM